MSRLCLFCHSRPAVCRLRRRPICQHCLDELDRDLTRSAAALLVLGLLIILLLLFAL